MKKKILLLVLLLGLTFAIPINNDYKVSAASTVQTKTYKITYKLNGGVNNKKNPSSFKKTSKTITLASPTRRGYTFKGWYSDAKFTNKVTSIKAGTKKNVTLYAKWVVNSYTVKFSGNGATSGKMSSLTNRKYGVAYNLPTNTFKKKGYTFGGWTTKKDGTGTVFKKSFKNLTTKSKGVVTLYAKWVPNTYTVKFNGNGATSGSMKSLTNRKYGVSYKVPTNNFKKTGYVFTGWTVKKDGTGTVYSSTKNIRNLTSKNKGVVTLYAKWKIKSPIVKAIKNTRYNKMNITVGKVANADGYEIYFSKSKTGSFKLAKSSASAGTIEIKNLKGSTTYYYKVRAYEKVNGKKVYSNFSKVYYKKSAAKPNLAGKIIYSSGYNQSTVGLYIENRGKKTLNIDDSVFLVYPYTNALYSAAYLRSGSNIIKANNNEYLYIGLEETRYFSDGGYIAYYFIYDGCKYLALTYDDHGYYA